MKEHRMLRGFYPEIEPYDIGFINVGDGHRIYYDVSGNKKGIPVVYLHGGPGGGSKPKHRRFFNPKKYRIIVFDQRGCGQSTPSASLNKNDTPHLIADMEKLRQHLNIKKWVVCGSSWGSTLGAAYAAAHPERVIEAVLHGIFLGRPSEIAACYMPDGVGPQMFPDAYEDYVSVLTKAERKNPIKAFITLITQGNGARRQKAIRAWCKWEGTLYMLGDPAVSEMDKNLDDMEKSGRLLNMALMETHYFKHGCFIDTDALLKKLSRSNVPATLLQGRLDLICPPQTAYDLHKAWKKSTLQIIEGEGHASDGPKTLDALIRATDAIAKKKATA